MYRDNAMPPPVVVRELVVLTRRGQGLGAVLVFVALMLVFGGIWAAADLRSWGWPMIGLGVMVPFAGIPLRRRRRRKLTLTRVGERQLLAIIDENVELELPVRCSGVQVANVTNKVASSYTVVLKVIDAKERAVLFQESRTALHGPVLGWFPVTEQTGPVPAFETSQANMIVELRDMLTAHANR